MLLFQHFTKRVDLLLYRFEVICKHMNISTSSFKACMTEYFEVFQKAGSQVKEQKNLTSSLAEMFGTPNRFQTGVSAVRERGKPDRSTHQD